MAQHEKRVPSHRIESSMPYCGGNVDVSIVEEELRKALHRVRQGRTVLSYAHLSASPSQFSYKPTQDGRVCQSAPSTYCR